MCFYACYDNLLLNRTVSLSVLREFISFVDPIADLQQGPILSPSVILSVPVLVHIEITNILSLKCSNGSVEDTFLATGMVPVIRILRKTSTMFSDTCASRRHGVCAFRFLLFVFYVGLSSFIFKCTCYLPTLFFILDSIGVNKRRAGKLTGLG